MLNARTEWKCLQPEKIAIDPNATSAEDDWKFWTKLSLTLLQLCHKAMTP